MQQQTIEIDGSLYEGGGQIIRNSIALSNILQVPFTITKIRSGRPNPGLNNQLITAINLMKQITSANVTNVKMGSQELYYEPKNKIISGTYNGGAKSAAAISLMFQSLLPTLSFGGKTSSLNLQGGTNVNKSPPSQSITRILQPMLQKTATNFQYSIIKEGFYPVGNGKLQVKVEPVQGKLKPVSILQRKPPLQIYIEIYLTKNGIQINEHVKSIKQDIRRNIKAVYGVDNIEVEVKVNQIIVKKFAQCYAVILHAIGEDNYFDGSYFPDKPQETAEECIEKASQRLITQLKMGGCMDDHHQDQLLLYMALAEGESQLRVGKEITPHTLAVQYVLSKFIPQVQFKIVPDETDTQCNSNIISITGIGLENVLE